MPYTNLKRVALLLVLGWGLALAAEEKEEGKKEEGAGKPQSEAARDQHEFSEKTGKLNVLKNHIEEADKRFRELVFEKAEAKTAAAKQAVIKEMVELNKQRNLDAIAYNKLKSDLAYRYPDMGDRLDKTYQTQDKRSVEEMEGAAGLDEMLTRTKKQVDKKFAPLMPTDEKPKVKVEATKAKEETKRLKLEK